MDFDQLKFNKILQKQTTFEITENQKKTAEENGFNLLPNELLLEIFQYLGIRELLMLSLVNSQLSYVSDDLILWRDLIHQNVGILDFDELSTNSSEIKIAKKIGLQEIFEQEKTDSYDSIPTNKLTPKNPKKEEIYNFPKRFFLEQVKKVKKAEKQIQQNLNRQNRITKMGKFIDKYINSFVIGGSIFCMFLYPSLMITLRADESYKSTWIVPFLSLILLSIIYAIWTIFAIWTIDHRENNEDYYMFWAIFFASLITCAFLFVLALYLDGKITISLSRVLVMFHVATGIFQLFSIVGFISIAIRNRSRLLEYILLMEIFALGLIVLDISASLTEKKINGADFSWSLVLLPEFCYNFLILVGLIVFALYQKIHEGSYSTMLAILPFILILILFTLSEIFIALKLDNNFNKSWIVISLPILIPSFLLSIITGKLGWSNYKQN
ncbi:dactylin [Anaeramoeba ignava]|uniref:Dactylin n=1 Tax=Anaeramoeba ignava TaxID=1746090 RepID=A0A9Q0RBF9_ANAIG|nr:dactylin [Anaeramoeba ignava]